jgi:predicted Zn-dependent protease
MHEVRCELMLMAPGGVKDASARAACAHVSELAPADPTPHLALGDALAHAGQLGAAHEELVKAAAKIGNLPKGKDDAWRKLIGLYATMGALTWTEDAIAAAGATTDPQIAAAAATVKQTRARYGVPRGAKFVTPADEPALVAASRHALELVYANKYGEAEQAIAAGTKRWRDAPGLFAARCDLLMRRQQLDAARVACARAIAIAPEESWALYLAGVLALQNTGAAGTHAGIVDLKQAVAADPELQQAWRALGKAYLRANDKAAVTALSADYQAKFGTPLQL